MLRQFQRDLEFRTRTRGFQDITAEVSEVLGESGLTIGLVTLQLLHTSASLLIQENADPDVRQDLERFFRRLVPDGDPLFSHTLEGPDDMPAHIRTVLTAVNLSLPFRERHLCLGTWQGLYLWEHRTAPHRRVVCAHFLGE